MTTAAKRYALRDFTDAGTGKHFKFGKPVDEKAGVLANYEIAGLVGDKPANAPAIDGGKTA